MHEIQRLDTAAHLGFCDDCLLTYAGGLEGGELLQRSAKFRESILRRLRRRGAAILFNKYTTVAAAACLAVLLWTGSSAIGAPLRAGGQAPPPEETRSFSLGEKLNNLVYDLSDTVGGFFSSLGNVGGKDPKAAQKEKEKVFDNNTRTPVADPALNPSSGASSAPDSSSSQ